MTTTEVTIEILHQKLLFFGVKCDCQKEEEEEADDADEDDEDDGHP